MVEIHLAPDQNFLFDEGGVATNFPTAFYELEDVFISAEAEVATPAPGPGTFEYNSISSYFTSFNSTNAIINFNLGLSNVLSVFGNLIPASHINNLAHDGMATLPPVNSNGTPASVTQSIFTRGGEKFPLEYNIDTIQTGDSTQFNQRSVDAQLTREGISAIRKFATQNWGMNLQTNLITDFPTAMFLFVHSKNTLVFDGQGGMQVMS